ncbi:hypothetical protein DERP_004880 [Dermatophagoides pteronyssinus]|uniref:Uncharacterized protein n=1 Tax=Dermatophagoides pteronyssinus TaxID=6956 RepID=A0ABQ8JSS0_DERPT|nr:hypothetical protein DERP_004880 [Dermatophagoides pteronyssinus]
MVDNVLVGRTALFERVQIVHVVHVSPQVNKRFGYLEPDMKWIKNIPATLMCCSRVISSQSKQQRVSPVK